MAKQAMEREDYRDMGGWQVVRDGE